MRLKIVEKTLAKLAELIVQERFEDLETDTFFHELVTLAETGLIELHAHSTTLHPIYVADRALMRRDYLPELREMFVLRFDALDELSKEILSVVYRFNHFSKAGLVSAKAASFSLWYGQGAVGGIQEFDAYYRRVRYAFNKLAKAGFVQTQAGAKAYTLNAAGGHGVLRPSPPA